MGLSRLIAKFGPPEVTEESRRVAEQEFAELRESLGRWRYLVGPLLSVAVWLWIVGMLLVLFLLGLVVVPLRFIGNFVVAVARMPRDLALSMSIFVAAGIGFVVFLALGAYEVSAMMLSLVLWLARPNRGVVAGSAAVMIGLGIAIAAFVIAHRAWADFVVAAFCVSLGLDNLRFASRGAHDWRHEEEKVNNGCNAITKPER